MKREVTVKRGWLLMVAVVFVVLLSAAVVMRELDINRIEAQNVQANKRQIAANRHLIGELQKTTDVLCERGNTVIHLINAALVLVGQRLQDDVVAGNAAAVRADRRFLTAFLRDREKLIREQTGEGPCAP